MSFVEFCSTSKADSSDIRSRGLLSMARRRSPACNVPVLWAVEPLRISEIKKGSSGRVFEARISEKYTTII